MRDYNFYVYIMSNKSRRPYLGVTSDLEGRTWEHKNRLSGFTAQYPFTRLVYFEWYTDIGKPLRARSRSRIGDEQRRLG